MRPLPSLFRLISPPAAVLTAVCALALFVPQTASAQADIEARHGGYNGGGYNGGGYNGGGLPGGSYQDSCRDIDLRGDVLTARCRNRDGYYNPTSLSLRDCRGNVENSNGNLRCTGGNGGNWGGNGGWNGGNDRLPDGNYQQSCRDIDLRGDRLTARCRMREGGYNYSSLSLRECRGGRVENLNGTLQCEGAYGGRLPSGSYRDTCKDISVRGDVLTARCRDKWGDYRVTSLSLRDCRSDYVENRKGQLTCRWN